MLYDKTRLGTALDGQTDSVKKYRIRLSVFQSKRTEFVWPSFSRRPDRFSQKVQNSSGRRLPVRSLAVINGPLSAASGTALYDRQYYLLIYPVDGDWMEAAER
jgi:hypothetical protein